MSARIARRPGRAMRRDWRARAVLVTVVSVLAGGFWISQNAPAHPPQPLPVQGTVHGRTTDPAADPVRRDIEIRQHFEQAVALLQAGQAAQAAGVLKQVLALAPSMPEAHTNLGFALLALKHPAPARDHFDRATVLNPSQANAYYGLALAHEARGDLDLALGAMRTYVHLARAEDDKHLRRARAAMWEWETQLARTRGNPGR